MIIGVYCVKDEKQGFLSPSFDLYDSLAIRGFSYSLSQQGIMSFAPEDYSLWKLGTFDTDTGLSSMDPQLIISAKEVIGNDN